MPYVKLWIVSFILPSFFFFAFFFLLLLKQAEDYNYALIFNAQAALSACIWTELLSLCSLLDSSYSVTACIWLIWLNTLFLHFVMLQMWEPKAFDQNHADWISKENQTWNCDPANYSNICLWKFAFTVQQEKMHFLPFLKMHHILLSR